MGKRILFVDDDLYVRDLYEEILKGDGYKIDTATNGEEGIAKLQQGGYDLVLLDILMPSLDGVGVLQELQKNPPQNPNGPIILLTNLGHDPLVKTSNIRGVASYLIKADLTPPDLINAVKKMIGD